MCTLPWRGEVHYGSIEEQVHALQVQGEEKSAWIWYLALLKMQFVLFSTGCNRDCFSKPAFRQTLFFCSLSGSTDLDEKKANTEARPEVFGLACSIPIQRICNRKRKSSK